MTDIHSSSSSSIPLSKEINNHTIEMSSSNNIIAMMEAINLSRRGVY